MSRTRFLQAATALCCLGAIVFSFAPWYVYEAQGNFSSTITISGLQPGFGFWTVAFSTLALVSIWIEKVEKATPVFAILATLSCVYALTATPDVNVNMDFGKYGSQSASWSAGWGLIAATACAAGAFFVSLVCAIQSSSTAAHVAANSTGATKGEQYIDIYDKLVRETPYISGFSRESEKLTGVSFATQKGEIEWEGERYQLANVIEYLRNNDEWEEVSRLSFRRQTNEQVKVVA